MGCVFNSAVEALEIEIAKHRDAYYNGQALVDDEAYDALVDTLSDLRSDSQQITSVGSPATSGWPKVKHEVPMGSLDKVKTPEEMRVWVRKVTRPIPKGHPTLEAWFETLVLTEKLDGLSISLQYRDGKCYQAVSRGGGEEGEDLTRNVVRMQGVPHQLPDGPEGPLTITVRGEILLPKDTFDSKYRSQGYSNPRNAASGTSRRFDGQGCEDLAIYCYWEDHTATTVVDRFKFLDGLGFKTPAVFVTALTPGVKTPHDIWVEYQQSLRASLPYEIDGLVLELNDLSYQESLGAVNSRPLGAIAFKFQPIGRETVAKKRVDQVGGQGRITPVAEFEAINLLGAEVTRASLYNQAYIESIGFDVGARIVVAKAGDVIPRVVRVQQGTGSISQPPTSCPSCGGPVESAGEYLICPNVGGCPAQTEGRLIKWCRELSIMEWGPALVELVASKLGVQDVAGLYRLTVGQLAGLDRMGTKSAQRAYDALRAPFPVSLDKYLGALSIPLCGPSTILMVMSAGVVDLPAFRSTPLPQLLKVPGLGPVKARTLYAWLAANGALLDQLGVLGVVPKERTLGTLTGTSFCFTGTMTHKREDLATMAEQLGGEVKSQVTKGLTYLVAAKAGTKAAKAEKLGTKILTEQQFLQLVGQSS